jgi:hypothetical protein
MGLAFSPVWEIGIAVAVLFAGYLVVAVWNYRDGYRDGYRQGQIDRKKEIITYGWNGSGRSPDR